MLFTIFHFALSNFLNLLSRSPVKNTKAPQVGIFTLLTTPENQRATNSGLAPFAFPDTGGRADVTTPDFAPASTNLPQDFAQGYFAQQFRFGAQAPSTPALNYSQNCFGDNFQPRFHTSNFPGFQLCTSSNAGFTFDLPAIQFGKIRTRHCHRHIRLILKPTILPGSLPLYSVLTSNHRHAQHISVTLGTRRKLSVQINASLQELYTRRGMSLVS